MLMISNDNQQYITVALYNAGNDRLERRIIQLGEKLDASSRETKSEFQIVKAEIQAVRENTIANGAKIDAYRDFTSIWFTVITVIVAFVGLAAPLLRDLYKDSRKSKEQEHLTEDKVQAMIDNAIAKAMRNINIVGK